jgi:hypothetical protein
MTQYILAYLYISTASYLCTYLCACICVCVCVCVRASEFVQEYAFALSNINNTQDVNYTNDRVHLFHSEYAAFAHCAVHTLPPVYVLCPV